MQYGKRWLDPNARVVAQIAPAVRVASRRAPSDLPKGESVMGKIVNALHRMGFDEVYDTAFSADLTIMEESAEFLEQSEKWRENLPLLTSCCPAWVKFVRRAVPGLQGECIYLPFSSGNDVCGNQRVFPKSGKCSQGKKTVMVSFMPCTAKKMEAKRPNSFTRWGAGYRLCDHNHRVYRYDPYDRH